MIKHIVMWTLKQEARSTSINQMKEMLEGMQNKVDGLTYLEVGINSISNDCECDLVLYTEFQNKSSLNEYQKHPDHLLIKKFVGPISKSRHQVDYEVNTSLRAF